MNNSTSFRRVDRKYLLLALGAFVGLGLEFAVVGLGYLAFGNFPDFQGPHWQLIIHWIMTCLIWSGSAIFLVQLSKTKMKFDIFIKGEKMQLWQWVAIVLMILLSLVMSYVGWDCLWLNMGYYAHHQSWFF